MRGRERTVKQALTPKEETARPLSRSNLVRSRRKKLVAVVVGVLLAGAPLAGFNIWLDRLIQQQILDDVAGSAKRAIALIETRLGRTVAALDALAEPGVESCRPADIEKLRRATFSASPIKELSVIAADGRTVCTDIGIPLGARKVLNSSYAVAPGGVLIDVVRLVDSNASFVRVRRPGAAGSSLAALVPVDLFLPQTSTQGGPLGVNARAYASDGLLIGEAGRPLPPEVKPGDLVTATLRSDQFGVTVTVSMPPGAADMSDLR